MTGKRLLALACAAGAALLVLGCEIVDQKAEAPLAPAARPPQPMPSTPETGTPSSAPGTTGEPVAAEPSAPGADASAVPPVSSDALADRLLAASQAAANRAISDTLAAQRRQDAEAERTARLAKRQAWLAAAQSHLRHLSGRIAQRDVAQSQAQLGLLSTALQSLRANLITEPAWDELGAALGALYSVTDSNSEQAALGVANGHLAEAMAILPVAQTPDPTTALPASGQPEPTVSLNEPDNSSLTQPAIVVSFADLPGLANKVAQVQALLKTNPQSARRQLQQIVTALSDSTLAEAFDLIDVSRRWLADSLIRGDWAAAERNAARLGASLDEAGKFMVAAEKQPATAAPVATTTAPQPEPTTAPTNPPGNAAPTTAPASSSTPNASGAPPTPGPVSTAPTAGPSAAPATTTPQTQHTPAAAQPAASAQPTPAPKGTAGPPPAASGPAAKTPAANSPAKPAAPATH